MASDAENSPSPQKRLTFGQYEDIASFDAVNEAKQYVLGLKRWKLKDPSFSFEGKKIRYVCKFDSKCRARLQILVPNNGGQVTVRMAVDPDTEKIAEHTHAERGSRGIDDDVKLAIIALLHDDITKPKEIVHYLREEGWLPPTYRQLYNWLNANKRKVCAPICRIGQLEEFLVPRFSMAPSLDEAIVIHSEFDYDVEPKWFGITWASHRLLAIVKQSKSVSIDATYKLNWHGFPVIVCGTTDAQRQFHPYAVALVRNEQARSYEFVFESLLTAVPDFKPTVLQADSAGAITSGFQTSFRHDYTRLNCWAHAERNFEERLKRDQVPDDKKEKVLNDIRKLQLSLNEEEFQVGARLFCSKWSRDKALREFVKYFRKVSECFLCSLLSL